MSERGYFGIGIEHTKTPTNVGTLWRSALNLGAAYVYTIGRRYKRQSSDTVKAWRHVPLFHYESFDAFFAALPYDARLVGVEIEDRAVSLTTYAHPARCVYLLGAEDHGLTAEAQRRCHDLVVIPSTRCLNVAVAGAIVMYDRATKDAV